MPGNPQVCERSSEADGEPTPTGELPETPGHHIPGEGQQPPGGRVQGGRPSTASPPHPLGAPLGAEAGPGGTRSRWHGLVWDGVPRWDPTHTRADSPTSGTGRWNLRCWGEDKTGSGAERPSGSVRAKSASCWPLAPSSPAGCLAPRRFSHAVGWMDGWMVSPYRAWTLQPEGWSTRGP